MLKEGLSPSVTVCVSASFPLSRRPASHRAPPTGEIMGRNIGDIRQKNCQGTKLEPGGATLGSSRPFIALSTAEETFSSSLMLIQVEPADGG